MTIVCWIQFTSKKLKVTFTITEKEFIFKPQQIHGKNILNTNSLINYKLLSSSIVLTRVKLMFIDDTLIM